MNHYLLLRLPAKAIRGLCSLFVLTVLLLLAGQVQAKSVLLLTTTEDPIKYPDGVDIVKNCISDFQYWQSLDPTNNQLVVKNGKLNDTVNPLVMADLFPAAPATAPYDVIATCNVYAQTLPSSATIVNQAIRTRVARAFVLFDEPGAFQGGWINAINDWQVTYNTDYYAGNGVSQIANTQSRFVAGSAFASDLATMGGHSYAVYRGVPTDNVLYTPESLEGINASVPPVPSNYPLNDKASVLVVPLARSYQDSNGMATGACVIASTDVSMFDTVRWKPAAMPAVAPNNYRKVSVTFLKATDPGGPCSPLPTITKSFDKAVVKPGDTVTLTIALQNNGGFTDAQGNVQTAAPVTDVQVTDNLPAPLILASVPVSTCGGTTLGTVGGPLVGVQGGTLPSTTCTITAQVQWPNTSAGLSACPASTTTTRINKIAYGSDFTATGGPNTTVIPNKGNSPFDAVAQMVCSRDEVPLLSVIKTADKTSTYKGDTVKFTITIANSSSVQATSVAVSDPVTGDWQSSPAPTWVCQSSDGAPCATASGSGQINESNLTVPANGSVTYTLTAVASGAMQSAINTVTVTPGGTAVCSAGAASCTSTVRVHLFGVISIAKTLTGQSNNPLLPGGTITYSVAVQNTSPSVPVQHAIHVTDPLAPGISGGTWTCEGECYGMTLGSLPLDVTLPGMLVYDQSITPWHTPSGLATYAITATVDPANTLYASIVNTANATTSGGDICTDTKTSSCSASAAAVPVVLPGSVLITKRLISSASVAPGGVATYEIKVSNPSTTNNVNQTVNVSDALPANASGGSWTCAGSVCPAASGSSLPLNQTLASLPSGAMVTYVVTVNVAANAAHGSTVNNTAIVTPTAPDLCTGNTCSSSALPVSVIVPGAVTVAKTLTSSAQATRGAAVTYQIVVGNSASGPIEHAVAVVDNLPSGLENGVLTCTVNCTNATITSATGTALAAQIAGLPAGTSVTFQVTANIKADAAANSSITNVATATPGSTRDSQEFCEGNTNSCSASAPPVKITVPDVPEPPVVQPVPATDHWALMLMSALLALAFVIHRRRSR